MQAIKITLHILYVLRRFNRKHCSSGQPHCKTLLLVWSTFPEQDWTFFFLLPESLGIGLCILPRQAKSFAANSDVVATTISFFVSAFECNTNTSLGFDLVLVSNSLQSFFILSITLLHFLTTSSLMFAVLLPIRVFKFLGNSK